MPLVSVVVIFLNEERFIEEAVQSVFDQTLEDWELILVDDGSTDRSTSIARKLAARNEKIRYVDHDGHKNRGMSASRNLGVAHARAPYIAFIDADDVWTPTKLEEQVGLLRAMPDVAMVCGAMLHWHSWNPEATDSDYTVQTGGVGDRRLDPPHATLTLSPLGRHTGCGTDILVRRTAFDSVGGFEEQFRGHLEDQAFFAKVFLRYPVYISSRVWLFYRQHDASCMARATWADLRRQIRIFVNWFGEDRARLADRRVRAAFRRAQCTTFFWRLRVLYDHLPTGLKRQVKRARDRVRPRHA